MIFAFCVLHNMAMKQNLQLPKYHIGPKRLPAEPVYNVPHKATWKCQKLMKNSKTVWSRVCLELCFLFYLFFDVEKYFLFCIQLFFLLTLTALITSFQASALVVPVTPVRMEQNQIFSLYPNFSQNDLYCYIPFLNVHHVHR